MIELDSHDGPYAPEKHSTRAKRGPSGRLTSRNPLGAGGRAAGAAAVCNRRFCLSTQSLVTTSSSSVETGPWYLFFAETRYQTPKMSGITIANGL